MLGALVRRFGHFDQAEEAVQEALLAASTQWPRDGIPDQPRSWLIRVGYWRMIDLLRAQQSRYRREREVFEMAPTPIMSPGDEVAGDQDDSLLLLFLCCHASLSAASQIALTLRAVGGLTTAEIAHGYGVTEAAMGQRITRAKKQIADAGGRFAPPSPDERNQRITTILQVLYLIFNEGYTATSGDRLSRVDLTDEAIRLTRMLRRALPEDPEVAGLLALMLLIDSRRAARSGTEGELITLEDQDRTQWNAELIREGTGLVSEAIRHGRVGPYQLQAAIAVLHAEAPSWTDTEWTQISALYAWLERLMPTPPVRLSRVVAVAMAHGPDRGLVLLEQLPDDPLVRPRERAVRAHLVELTGDAHTAIALYQEAARLTGNVAEQRYLQHRAERLQTDDDEGDSRSRRRKC